MTKWLILILLLGSTGTLYAGNLSQKDVDTDLALIKKKPLPPTAGMSLSSAALGEGGYLNQATLEPLVDILGEPLPPTEGISLTVPSLTIDPPPVFVPPGQGGTPPGLGGGVPPGQGGTPPGLGGGPPPGQGGIPPGQQKKNK